MRAGGIASRKVMTPVVLFATLGMIVTGACSLWLTPWSIRETYRVLNQLAAAQMTADIQPRVFAEQFPNKTLFVGDVVSGPVVQWRNIFIADLTPPDQRKQSAQENGDSPGIMIASEAIAVTNPAQNQIRLQLRGVSTYNIGKDPDQYFNSSYPQGDQLLEAQRPGETKAQAFRDIDTLPLWKEMGKSNL